MNYQLITSGDAKELVEMVEAYLDSGWKPQGGIATSNLPECHTLIYSQAVVKEKD